MIFIILVIAFVIYLAISFVVIRFAMKQARTSGRRPWVWGGVAAFIMYNLVFWDWIPTVVAHKYYCANEAGFWVYKTLDEWQKENPGVIETLSSVIEPSEELPNGYRRMIDQRFVLENHTTKPAYLLSTTVFDRRIVDSKNGEILYKNVNIGSGGGNLVVSGYWKFWLNLESCGPREIWKITKKLEVLRGSK